MGLIILAVPLLLLWFMVSRGRKQQRQLAATQDALVAGTRVMTSSGLFAEVVAVEDDAVVLEIAPGVHTRWNKRAIGQVLPATEDTDSGEAVSVEDTGPIDPARVNPVGVNPVDVSADRPKSTEDVRSEAGYAALPEPGVTEGSTGTTGTDGR